MASSCEIDVRAGSSGAADEEEIRILGPLGREVDHAVLRCLTCRSSGDATDAVGLEAVEDLLVGGVDVGVLAGRDVGAPALGVGVADLDPADEVLEHRVLVA